MTVDTVEVENTIPAYQYGNRMLDYLIHNVPMGYVKLVLSGEAGKAFHMSFRKSQYQVYHI